MVFFANEFCLDQVTTITDGDRLCLLSGLLGGLDGNEGVSGIGQTSGISVVGQTSVVGVAVVSNGVVGESVMGIGVGSIRIGGIGVSSHGSGYGLDSGGNNLRDLMDRGGSLLGGQTSGLSISESSEEFGLGSGYGFIISKVGSGDLGSLDVIVDRGLGSVESSLSFLYKGEVSGLGLGNLGGVLNGDGTAYSGNKQNCESEHFGLCVF